MPKIIALLLSVAGVCACWGETETANINDLLSADHLTDEERDALVERGVRERMTRLGVDRLSASFPLILWSEEQFDELQEAIEAVVQSRQDVAEGVAAGVKAALEERESVLRAFVKDALEKDGVALDAMAMDALTKAAAEKIVETAAIAAGVAVGTMNLSQPALTVNRHVTVAEPEPRQNVPPAPPEFQVVTAQESGWRGWTRRTVEIESPDAADHRDQVLAMMAAALAQHQRFRPDVVSVRLWDDYPNGGAKNRIVYAPGGCGWAGDECTGEHWVDLLRGEIPDDLKRFGR
ncbi:MAG: hypothetical protein F4X43_07285 [Acidobacteria bacterium]|nr:hypothetical protein [Acidobacteriota bacterium]MYI38751.1 hypothetical protein [Acidobacteriota bacterium]